MKTIFFLISVCLSAGEIATVPPVGYILSSDGTLARLTGISGALIAEPAGEERLTAAAYSGRLLLSVSDGELRAGCGSSLIPAPEAPQGRTVFGFSRRGDAGSAYSPETGLLQIWSDGRWKVSRINPDVFGGDVLATALPDPRHLSALVRGAGLRLVLIRLSDNAVAEGCLIHPEAHGPAALLPSGDIVYAAAGVVTHRDPSGSERPLDLPAAVSFNVIGTGWLEAVAGNGARYAIRLGRDVRVTELPEVSR